MLADMSDTDLELLARYTRQHAEDAFAEIVRRHLGLVYSAALRQVRSPQLAEEVTQSAFIDLARSAGKLKPDTILTAWLYQVTRRTAIDVVRREASRQLREQIATEMTAMNATAADWTHIEPLLDEAMHALDDTDRAAVLLRYFENKSLREVGATLGTSENAAQKRLARAVERLREFFAKRGVTVGTSGLVVVISANAIQAAPVGLVSKTATAAALAETKITATATVTVAKTIVMTTLQKTLIMSAIIVVGVGSALVIHQRFNPQASNAGVAQNQPSGGSSNKTNQTEFPQASWKFAGYVDPESGYQSFMWAMSQGNVEITLDSLTPEARMKWERNMKKPKPEYGLELARRTKQTELFRISDKQSISSTETHLLIESVGASNENPAQEQWAQMIKVGSDWKYQGWVGN